MSILKETFEKLKQKAKEHGKIALLDEVVKIFGKNNELFIPTFKEKNQVMVITRAKKEGIFIRRFDEEKEYDDFLENEKNESIDKEKEDDITILENGIDALEKLQRLLGK